MPAFLCSFVAAGKGYGCALTCWLSGIQTSISGSGFAVTRNFTCNNYSQLLTSASLNCYSIHCWGARSGIDLPGNKNLLNMEMYHRWVYNDDCWRNDVYGCESSEVQ